MQQCGVPRNRYPSGDVLVKSDTFSCRLATAHTETPGALLGMTSQSHAQGVHRLFRIRFWKNLLRALAGGISSIQTQSTSQSLGELSFPELLNCQARIRALEKGYPVYRTSGLTSLPKSGPIPHSRDQSPLFSPSLHLSHTHTHPDLTTTSPLLTHH